MARKRTTTGTTPHEETMVLEKDETKEPKRYTVTLYNDDFTTQDFVVHVLMTFFHRTEEDAHHLMLKVHLEGKARVGTYTKDIAESKVAITTSYSRKNGMPLLVTAEPE